MTNVATYEDANLILRLYELRREEKLREARAWFVENFYAKTVEESMKLSPPGSKENAYVRMVTSYWNMVASFITSGVLNEELFFESGQEMLLTWVRVQPLISDMRKMMGNPNAWKNLETVAGRFRQHMNSAAPGAYDAFVARMGSRPEQAATTKGS